MKTFFTCKHISIFAVLAISVFILFGANQTAHAQQTLLTLRNTETQENIALTDADLMSLPQQDFKTSTPWTSSVDMFSGPSLADVLAKLIPVERIGEIHLIAEDQYDVPMPVELLSDSLPIVANRLNQQPYSLRHKGPLWVMFPFDDNPDFKTGVYISRAVWQLTSIDVTPK